MTQPDVQAVPGTEELDISYNASAITVLEGLEAVRKRPGMYIGSTGERGLHHLVYVVVDNSVDEALAGHADAIHVTLLEGGGVRVVDNGRGIPVDEHPVERKPALEVVMTMLHAGGKFGGAGYKVSGGLHGVGVSVVNALSSRLEVEVARDGYRWRQAYRYGVPEGPIERGEPTADSGTTTTFWASDDIFETTFFDFETLSTRLREMAFLNKGLEIVLRDERPQGVDEGAEDDVDVVEPPGPREVRYRYDGGLVDYVAHLNRGKDAVHPTVVAFEAESNGEQTQPMSLEVAMQWNTAFTESVHTFANTINTHEGGTHEEGFRAALTSVVNRYGSEKKLLKGDEKLTGEDIREGLAAIVSVKMAHPQFEGQTKTKLGNTEVRSFVLKTCNDWLVDWMDRNPGEAKTIITKASQAARARVAAAQARKLARRKSLLESGSMPGTLADCQSTDPRESELFIVEGDSAGGPAKQGRDPRVQAILPIRGKILNVEKARIDRILQNQEVQAIISAIGTGVQDEFDMNRLRYHKVVLMADADVDGQHITTLLLTLLFRFMRPIIEQGHVYLAHPPLYKIKWTGRDIQPDYAYSDREKDELVRLGIEAGKRLPKDEGVQRYKGLGEMNDDELWETTMDPEQRILRQVSLDDAAQADEIFTTLMGEDVESRRKFIQRNARDVRFLDI